MSGLSQGLQMYRDKLAAVSGDQDQVPTVLDRGPEAEGDPDPGCLPLDLDGEDEGQAAHRERSVSRLLRPAGTLHLRGGPDDPSETGVRSLAGLAASRAEAGYTPEERAAASFMAVDGALEAAQQLDGRMDTAEAKLASLEGSLSAEAGARLRERWAMRLAGGVYAVGCAGAALLCVLTAFFVGSWVTALHSRVNRLELELTESRGEEATTVEEDP